MGAQQGEAGHRQKGGHHGSGGQPGQHRGKKAEKQRCAAVGQGVIKIAGRPLIQKLEKIQHHNGREYKEAENQQGMHIHGVQSGDAGIAVALGGLHEVADGNQNSLQRQKQRAGHADKFQLAKRVEIQAAIKQVLSHDTLPSPQT